ncbi:MAG: hypothetical protein FJ029_00580 [Actinobacteria bacterium]|nr:hypothetical protein [Actinomycetota bacterium]
MSTEATFDDVVEALARPGCPICRLAARRAQRFLDAYCYEHVNDDDLRALIRSSRGFCRRHATDFLNQLDTLAAAITYRDLLATLIDELARLGQPRRGAARALRGIVRRGVTWTNLTDPAECPVCVAERVAEGRSLDVLAEGLAHPRLAAALSKGDPLCLGHLRALIARRAPTPELLARQAAGWGRLRDHLLEIARKADYRFAEERLTPAERTAVHAAVNAIAGLSGLPPDDAALQIRKLRRGGSSAVRACLEARTDPAEL